MPGQQRVGGHDRHDVLEHAPGQFPGLGGQTNPLIVSEAQPPRSELFPEHTVLLLEVVDHIALLLMIQPAIATSRNRNGCDSEGITRAYLVDPLDPPAIMAGYEDEERGYPPYHPLTLTKVWVYAY